MKQGPNRYRGVVLTLRGLQRLEEAIALAQEQEKFGSRFTQAELSERAKLSIKTIKKIREGNIPTDETSVRALFSAFVLVLETADYGQPESSPSNPEVHSPNSNSPSTPKIDWGEKPDTALFFGRTAELATLSQWVQGDQCRLVTLLGMGGIGKTSLAAKLANQVYDRFDYVIWRSLREAPPLDEILVRLIQFLSDQQETEINLPTRLGERIIRLLHYLREHRCLVVLDNLESILQAETAGHYRDGYEGYGELIERIGSTEHQSCLLLTSRECPRELAPLAGDLTPVRLWSVGSIDTEAGREILKTKGLALDEADDQGQELIRRCSGNPQALHLVATAIQREFLGDVDDFLQEQVTAVEDVRSLLDQHLSRLAPLERSVLFWLAINREPVGLDELMEDLLPPVTKQEVRGALRGLSDRYLVETVGKQFTLQNVIMEFTTDRLVEQIQGELQNQKFDLFHTHALIKATAKEYIQAIQARLVLDPILDSIENLNSKVIECLEKIRLDCNLSNGYATGTLLNLLRQNYSEIKSINFSGLTIRQACLMGLNLYGLNFSNSLFVRSSLTQPSSYVYAVAFSPDGTLLATANGNHHVQVWSVIDQQLLITFFGHTNFVKTLAFSSNGFIIASGSEDSTVRIWNIKEEKCVHVFSGHTSFVRSLAFSSDGNFLVSGGGDSTIRLWHVQQLKCIHVFSGHNGFIWSVAFSPDGKLIASGSEDSTIRLWDTQRGQCVHVFPRHNSFPMSVAFNFDGKLLVSGSENSTIQVWDIQQKLCTHVLLDHSQFVMSVALSSDGNLLASGGGDCTIRLWDIQQKKCIHVFLGHASFVRSVAFSPDSQLLASGGEDCTIRLWDIQQKQCIHVFRGYSDWVFSVSFSPDGKLIANGSGDGTIRLWDIHQQKCIHLLIGHTSWVRTVVFSSDSKFLISGSGDGTIRLWNIEDRKCVHVFSGETNWIRTVAFSPDSQFFAHSTGKSNVHLWEIQSRKCLHIFEGHTSEVRAVSFSPNGNFLASGSDDATIRLWDVYNRQCIGVLDGHCDWVRTVDFSPDGNFLASGSDDATIQLWDIGKQQCVHVFEGHADGVNSVAFSPDGQIIASGSSDSTIRLWNVQKRQYIDIFKGHTNWVTSVVFSPDGHTLVSGSRDGKIRLWNVSTKSCLAVLQVPRPYEGTNIAGVRGLTEAQRASLLALGAIDCSRPSNHRLPSD